MYDADALLDELDDVVTSHDDEEDDGTISLDDDTDDSVDLDDEDDDLGGEDLEGDADVEDILSAEESESWSDDPVRMYLTQMGEIPLLTRQQEIALAKKIEITRAKFRRKVIECDYVMQQAVRVLRRVADGELPFDRTVQVSVTDRLEKEQILGRLPHNLATLTVLLKRNRRDYHVATSKSRAMAERRAAWRRLGRCRRRAVRLVEELGLRTQRIEPAIITLEEFSHRVDELKAQHRRAPKQPRPCPRARAVADGVSATSSGPPRRRPPVCETACGCFAACMPSTRRPSAASPKATCGWWSRSPRSIATGA